MTSKQTLAARPEAEDAATEPERVDFSRSIPPVVPEVDAGLRRALARITGETEDFGILLRSAPFAGVEQDRAAAAQLLARRWGKTLDPTDVLLANGTQSMIALLLSEVVGRGNRLLSERLTYSLLPTLARRAEVALSGVEMDGEGILPDALDAACARLKPKALFCNPTVTNPTTAIMSRQRRLDIIAVARLHGIAIIEDDVLGFLHPEAPPPIAALAPDITWYLMSMTKCVAHGLRVSIVVPPAGRARPGLPDYLWDLSSWAASPLITALLSALIADQSLDGIFRAIHAEAEARQRIATRLLGAIAGDRPTGALHLWLELGAAMPRARLATEAEQRGVRLRMAERFSADGIGIPNAVRLSLSSPLARSQVERGLGVIAEILAAGGQ